MENTIITITAESIGNFNDWLRSEERSEGTVAKYTRDLRQLSAWLANQPMTRESLTKWKEQLITDGLEPVTINSKLAAVNTYCRYLGLNLKIKFLRIQRRLFREEGRELKKHEYERLIAAAADQGDGRLTLLMETIASTGIRVSEVEYIMFVAGIAGVIYGSSTNNNMQAQVMSFYQSGKTNPGDVWLYIGIAVAVIGVIRIISAYGVFGQPRHGENHCCQTDR